MNIQNKILFESLTFDDVLLLPSYSEYLPHEINIKTHLTRDIDLNIPFISAAMDTVTESNLATSIALEGGIGFIHKNMTIKEQAHQVRKVKRYQSGMISDPISLNPNDTVKKADDIMNEYRIGGIPVVDTANTLVGIITNRDIRFHKKGNTPVSKLMTKGRDNIKTAKEYVDIESASDILQANKIEKLPIVDNNYKLIGLITYKDILKNKNKPNACKDSLGRLRVGAAVGVGTDTLDRIEVIKKANVDVIVIDTAHAHSKIVIDKFKEIRKAHKDIQIIVGNIVTKEAAEELIKAGVNGLKVGIGPGSICTTRVIAGIGMPQLSAVLSVSEIARKLNMPVISDGGIRFSGDVTKAIAAGASSVMIGSLFAGTEEAPGQVLLYEGRKYKVYRGMGSVEAMEKGSKDRYFQSHRQDRRKMIPEGIVGRVPFKGQVSEVLHQLVGGLRTGMGYTGTKNIPSLQQAKFIKITQASLQENHPHDIQIIREAPNYSL